MVATLAEVASRGSSATGQTTFVMSAQEGFGWVCYDSEGLQLMFFRWDTPLPVAEGFAAQPGDGGGESSRSSFSIEIPEADFPAVYERLKTAGSTAMTDAPTWRQESYWGWTVNDPMGDTIELYYSPAAKPEGDEPIWSPS